MKNINTKIVDYLNTKDGTKVNIFKMVLNESADVPEAHSTSKYGVTVTPVQYPAKKFKSFMDNTDDLDFETDKYDYYQITESKHDGNKSTWNLRVLKTKENI